MEESAHAKVNLFLRVLRRREDGFHEIETLIAPITLHDSLAIEPADRLEFHCEEPGLAGADNLVVRAARAFFAKTKREPKVRLTLRKKIPHGAGLGGGSSDAAATLRGLNRFFEAELSNKTLCSLAAELGSDVPFFLNETVATCSGRGEIVMPASLPASLNLLLLKPEFGVPSVRAYSRWQATRELASTMYESQKFADITWVNDLERPVFEKFIFLAQMKSWLRVQPEVGAALMSGSGSAIFAVLRSNVDGDLIAQRAKSELDAELWWCVCETIVSPQYSG
ncbi:MAG: 4-(cytidine 5'-diphospho)-2-C-methyl-D-erythritol kinase [Verrucomicrobia bacterium]|nr:MAG: 4-(cytidine 5'-diphospho)-2-C-methyl-D-erythritol kinase [Verrucomicrobiota bacterium]